jgi:hypothetical protein
MHPTWGVHFYFFKKWPGVVLSKLGFRGTFFQKMARRGFVETGWAYTARRSFAFLKQKNGSEKVGRMT